MISIFICTYNPNKEFLLRVVNSILNQTLDKSEWEFYVIDNNSTTPVAEIDFIKELKISVLFEKRPGLSFARECGVNAAKGDILVFVDDDNVLDVNYLISVKEAFEDKEIGILAGNIIPEYVEQPNSWFLQHEEMLAIRRLEGSEIIFNESIYCNYLFPLGAGMSIRKNLIEDYYYKHLNEGNLIKGRKGTELSSCEDYDLDFYAMHRGYKIGYNPKMKMVHILPPKRLTFDYFVNLSTSSLKSSFHVNKKWAPIFNQNVFEHFNLNLSKIRFKILVNTIGSVIDKNRRMYKAFLLELYKLKKNSLSAK